LKKEKKNLELINDDFYVWESRFGLWNSETKEGKHLLCGLTREVIIRCTTHKLEKERNGTMHLYTTVVGDAYVGGKL
jgi:hypothetical protein